MRLPMATFATSFLLSLPRSGFVPAAILVCGGYFGLMTFLCEAVISFNRASALFLGLRYNDVWAKIMQWVYVFVIVPPVFATWNIWFENVTIDYENSTLPELGVDIKERNPKRIPWMNSIFYISIICAITSIWNLFWNMYTLITVVKKKLYKTLQNSDANRLNLQMFAFSFYSFVIQFGTTTLVILMRYTDFINISVPIDSYFLDAVHFSVHWIFLYTQKDVQVAVKQVLRRLFRRGPAVSPTEVAVMPNQWTSSH
uniref:Serpentine receptor class gamma n=1 Tax=Panagrellus redivivus TaxID=6233 RepID=A0A7E4V8E0_PANRE